MTSLQLIQDLQEKLIREKNDLIGYLTVASEDGKWYSVGETAAGIREVEAQIRVLEEVLTLLE